MKKAAKKPAASTKAAKKKAKSPQKKGKGKVMKKPSDTMSKKQLEQLVLQKYRKRLVALVNKTLRR